MVREESACSKAIVFTIPSSLCISVNRAYIRKIGLLIASNQNLAYFSGEILNTRIIHVLIRCFK